jgi:hypothetical protein
MRGRSQYQTLKKSAARLRSRGQRGDTVLAHINPEEALFLNDNFGGDVNPHTGLPQFGLFGKVFRGAERALRKPFKAIAPLAGSIVGGMFGGPAGAVAGGSIGGALKSRHNMLNNALKGGVVGLGHSILSPMIGQGLNLNPDSLIGQASMMNAPSWGETLGSLGSLGATNFLGGKTGKSATEFEKNYESEDKNVGSDSKGGLFGMGLLDTGLLGATVAGTLLAKSKQPAYGSPENESMQQAINRNRPQWGPEHAYNPPDLTRKVPKFPPKGYRKTKWKFFPTPEEQEAQLLEAQQEMGEPDYERRYAKGGRVKGYYAGSEGGQSDKIPVDLPEDSYIMDSTSISLLGDGNSLNGAKKIRKSLDSFQKSGIARDEGDGRNVRALVSDSEMYISPREVKAVGGGSVKKGFKKLDKMRVNLRKHKGVKKFLPPKSKPLESYLR